MYKVIVAIFAVIAVLYLVSTVVAVINALINRDK